jgi:hypothetical protein
MKTIMDYNEFKLQICGYLRRSVLSDNDYKEVEIELYSRKFQPNDYPKDKQYFFLQYLVDIIVLRYYSKKVPKGNQFKQRAFSLYFRIINRYPDFHKEIDIDPYTDYKGFSSPSYIKTYIKNIIAGSYPHQILTFCYKELIDGWGNNKIISDLSEKTLDNIFNRFINEYSNQSGLPSFFVTICFIDLKDKMHQRLKNVILKRDGTTPKRMADYLNWITGSTKLAYYYRADKEHDITDWCNRVKEKTIIGLSKNLIAILD